jgi:hypothetical protein
VCLRSQRLTEGFVKRQVQRWAWWFMTIIPALNRLRQENPVFQTTLGYIVSSRP